MSLSVITCSIVNDDLMTMSFAALGQLVRNYACDLYENEGASLDAAETWLLEEICALDAMRPGFGDFYTDYFI